MPKRYGQAEHIWHNLGVVKARALRKCAEYSEQAFEALGRKDYDEWRRLGGRADRYRVVIGKLTNARGLWLERAFAELEGLPWRR